MLFLDFEASGLGEGSWPIELGLAWIEQGKTRAASRLIRPHADWDEDAWSAESAEVHRIPRPALDRAWPAERVAAWAAERMAGQVVVADAPEFDGLWLRTLFAIAPGLAAPPRLADFDAMVATHFGEAGVRRVYGALDEVPNPHRAGPDAQRLAQAWLAGLGVER